jgi:hypothetical protein
VPPDGSGKLWRSAVREYGRYVPLTFTVALLAQDSSGNYYKAAVQQLDIAFSGHETPSQHVREDIPRTLAT